MQLEFCWRDDGAIRDELESRTSLRLELNITDNRSTMISVKPSRNGAPTVLRLHRMFLAADRHVIEALARWIKNKREPRAAAVIDQFIGANKNMLQARPRRPARTHTHGVCLDLKPIFDELNREYFDGRVNARITWGRMPAARRRRCIRFGSYYAEDDLIRIHPALDQTAVPRRFVKYIVFHEMLHADLGIAESPTGRRSIHNRAFRHREQAYPDYSWAVAWQNAPGNLRILLRATVRGHSEG